MFKLKTGMPNDAFLICTKLFRGVPRLLLLPVDVSELNPSDPELYSISDADEKFETFNSCLASRMTEDVFK